MKNQIWVQNPRQFCTDQSVRAVTAIVSVPKRALSGYITTQQQKSLRVLMHHYHFPFSSLFTQSFIRDLFTGHFKIEMCWWHVQVMLVGVASTLYVVTWS